MNGHRLNTKMIFGNNLEWANDTIRFDIINNIIPETKNTITYFFTSCFSITTINLLRGYVSGIMFMNISKLGILSATWKTQIQRGRHTVVMKDIDLFIVL